MFNYTLEMFQKDVVILRDIILKDRQRVSYDSLYPVPRGGIPVALQLSSLIKLPVVDKLRPNSLVIDDVVDSGKTRLQFSDHDFACLHIKSNTPQDRYPTYFASIESDWIQYFWEQSMPGSIEDNIVRLLEFIGEDPNRPGLIDTPARVARMYKEFFQGYDPQRAPEITVFKNGSDGVSYDEMLRDEGYFFSFCEHHMVPFFGEFFFGYIPGDLLLGASKISRVIDYYAGRLQIAERLVNDVVTCIEEAVAPKGLILVMKARHLCKEMRGVRKWNSPFEAIAVRGYFAENRNGCKDEFMSRIQGR